MTYDAALPPLDREANKYTRGKLTVIAGSDRYTGAAVLAACASERMGAGYTEVVTVPEAVPLVRQASPSLVVLKRSQWEAGALSHPAPGHPRAAVIGPGFVGDDHEKALLLEVLRQAACPVLVDGGALGLLTGKKVRKAMDARAARNLATVLTPHGGEAARLARGLGIPEGATPEELAGELARHLWVIVALKGPVTYLSDGFCTLAMDEGTPALAKAGTGDVLAGMIGALLAQGADPLLAAYSGALIHARAGREASQRLAERSVIAGDLVDSIPAIIKGM